jgi:hypothetical protein
LLSQIAASLHIYFTALLSMGTSVLERANIDRGFEEALQDGLVVDTQA